jgi:RNA polymerase sigma-70 factor (ECF subfamily)
MAQAGEITELLAAAAAGSPEAGERLAPLVYAELRQLAAAYMRRESPQHTLQSTALVHEAYLRLLGQRRRVYKNRGHFYAVAAHLMRQILVDHARARRAQKRGGGAVACDLDAVPALGAERPAFLLALDEALRRLAERSPRQMQVVEMRYFGGLSEDEVAEALGVSARTVKRDWTVARAWLHLEMSK